MRYNNCPHTYAVTVCGERLSLLYALAVSLASRQHTHSWLCLSQATKIDLQLSTDTKVFAFPTSYDEYFHTDFVVVVPFY